MVRLSPWLWLIDPLAHMLIGRRVACGAIDPTVGMWAEYTLVRAQRLR